MYVCQLPPKEQQAILSRCRKLFESLAYEVDIEEELENVNNSKVCDVLHMLEG